MFILNFMMLPVLTKFLKAIRDEEQVLMTHVSTEVLPSGEELNLNSIGKLPRAIDSVFYPNVDDDDAGRDSRFRLTP